MALFLAATIVGFLPNAGSLLCTYEYGNYTIRAKSDLTIAADQKSNAENKTSGLDKDYATAWTKLFATRLRNGRIIQGLFGNVWTSNVAVNMARYTPVVANFLMKKTHGVPFG